MSKFPVEPLGALLFVEPAQASKIQLVDPRKAWRGKVLAAGPGEPLPEGGSRPMSVAVGDVVYLHPSRAIEGVFNQTRVWITDEKNVLAMEAA